MNIDLHGHHPNDIVGDVLTKIVQQAWETGADRLCLIHGHGRARGRSPGFYNTKTGYFGLAVRRRLRHSVLLRQWIKYTTLDCRRWGETTVKLKANPSPSRSALDPGILPEPRFGRDEGAQSAPHTPP